MPVRMLAANPLVREDAGKVAFVSSPITFCAEEKDDGANLHLLHADVGLLADPSVAKVEEFDFHAGAKGIDDKGQGGHEDIIRRMVKLEVPAWREPLPAAVAAAGEGAAEVAGVRAALRRVRARQARARHRHAHPVLRLANRGGKRNDRLAARLIFALGYSGSHGHHDMSLEGPVGAFSTRSGSLCPDRAGAICGAPSTPSS